MRRAIPKIFQHRLASFAFGLIALQGCSSLSTQPGAVVRGGDRVAEPQVAVGTGPSTPGKVSPPTIAPASIGHASWYGPGFVGKKTASGEIFDDSKLTAAHKSLPLGSRAKVTNLSNGREVHVEINDRGPYAGNRIIDLSKAAARALGMIDRGVVRVRVEPVETGGPAQ